MTKPFRRVVTGHDDAGRAIIQSDAPPERVKVLSDNGPTFYEVWNTRDTPAPIDRRSGEPPEAQLTLAPPPRGTRIRVLDIPPETPEMLQMDAKTARKHFAEIGAAGASTHSDIQSRHPHMHRTQTIDYGIVLEGEITLDQVLRGPGVLDSENVEIETETAWPALKKAPSVRVSMACAILASART